MLCSKRPQGLCCRSELDLERLHCGEPVKMRLTALKFTHSHTLKVFMLLYADGVFAIPYKHERARVTLIHREDLLRSTVVLGRQPGHITHASRGGAAMDFVLLFSS